MALQFSVTVRNARLDAIESAIGVSAILRVRSGAVPANTGTADAGTVLATINLASDWMSAAASGQKSMSGLPVSDNSADGTGTAGHFRIYASDGTTCHAQGTVTATGGGGDMEVDNTSFVTGQNFQITAFTINEPNS
jgi:hypothetical protein